MAMTVIDSEGIADEILPVAQLAAHMRLADGFESVPGVTERLQLRLRAAIGAVERRLAKALIGREFVVAGPAKGGRRVRLPIAPVDGVVSVSVERGGDMIPLAATALEQDPHAPVAILGSSVAEGEWLRIALRAGFGPWSAIPGSLQQAVLLMAEALDAGEGPALVPLAETLIAPFRQIRIGSAG